MMLELDDEELSDVREALRLQLAGLLKQLANEKQRKALDYVRLRLERIEELYLRLDRAAVTGDYAATH
ncbi:MAG: hypothetical protein JNK82_44425 [Myxococcaceae bacterium]|nr:hypothetical protein [Myxococcaceae bacterium]